MIDDLAALRGGELNAAITSADVRTQPPARLWTQTGTPFHQDNMVLAVLYDVTIRAEKTLAVHAGDDAVTDLCQLLQKTMEADFPNAVERIAGRKVIAFVRGTTFNPDIASELLMLGGTPCPTTAGAAANDQDNWRLRGPERGKLQDATVRGHTPPVRGHTPPRSWRSPRYRAGEASRARSALGR